MNNEKNHTLSDFQKVECLKNISSKDLLYQQALFEKYDIFFRGPSMDGILLPEPSYIKLLRYLRVNFYKIE